MQKICCRDTYNTSLRKQTKFQVILTILTQLMSLQISAMNRVIFWSIFDQPLLSSTLTDLAHFWSAYRFWFVLQLYLYNYVDWSNWEPSVTPWKLGHQIFHIETDQTDHDSDEAWPIHFQFGMLLALLLIYTPAKFQHSSCSLSLVNYKSTFGIFHWPLLTDHWPDAKNLLQRHI